MTPTRNQLSDALVRARQNNTAQVRPTSVSPRAQLLEQIQRAGRNPGLRTTTSASAGGLGSNRANISIGRGNLTATQFVDYQVATRRALTTLANGEHGDGRSVGNRMLNDINARGGGVSITHGQDNHADLMAPTGGAYRTGDGRRGAGGVGMAITWNHENHSVENRHRPAFIGLGHELVHTWRAAMGETVRVQSMRDLFNNRSMSRQDLSTALQGAQSNATRDEAETVGLMQGPRVAINSRLSHRPRPMPTENLLRSEHNVQPRTSYTDRHSGPDVSLPW